MKDEAIIPTADTSCVFGLTTSLLGAPGYNTPLAQYTQTHSVHTQTHTHAHTRRGSALCSERVSSPCLRYGLWPATHLRHYTDGEGIGGQTQTAYLSGGVWFGSGPPDKARESSRH